MLATAFGIHSSVLCTVHQIHGTDILIVDGSSTTDFSRASCDSIIARRPGIAIGVLTADCVPIMLFDPEHRTVAAIHTGWKGAAGNLPGKTVRTMVDQVKTQPGKLVAAVGPSIGPCCYEVDERVFFAFSRHNDSWPKWAKAVSGNRWMLDLPQASVDLLIASGIRQENIVFFDICTCCHQNLFYSHRRDKGTTGRQISFIMLK